MKRYIKVKQYVSKKVDKKKENNEHVKMDEVVFEAEGSAELVNF